MKDNLHIVVLAAGKGSRMQSPLPKPMLHVGSRPMIGHVLDAADGLSPASTRVVIGPQMCVTRSYVAPVPCVVQRERLGTGHAAQIALKDMDAETGTMIVLSGDVPLITRETLEGLVGAHIDRRAAVSVLGFETENPAAYGRLITDRGGLQRIVEAKDATHAERQIRVCNGGIYAIDLNAGRLLLPRLNANNAAGELYLTDLVGLARDEGLACGFSLANEQELEGANTIFELAKLDRRYRELNPVGKAA